MKIEELKGYKDKSIAILGYGKEGKSSLDFLLKLGFKNITILDSNEKIEKKEGIKYILGNTYIDNIGEFDLIFKSPGISPYNKKISQHKNKLISQTEIFINNYKGDIIGITGTKGKSTTSTLLYLTLKEAGYNTKIVGNIGNPVLDEVDLIGGEKHDFIVYEMSSYMLEGLNTNLYIGYINNIYDCHLDWHEGKSNYTNAKINILRNSKNKISNTETRNLLEDISNVQYFGTGTNIEYKSKSFHINNKEILQDENFKLDGLHNRINITGILSILNTIKEDKNLENKEFKNIIKALKSTLESFNGLPHRLQNIGNYNGITFIDDAIASTPDSTIAAIKTYEQNIGTLFLGDMDSGFDFTKLKETIINYKIPNIVIFPESGNYILGDFKETKFGETIKYKIGDYNINIFKTDKMSDAVNFAYKNTSKGKICLLSTGGPTFTGDRKGIFKGYIDQGTKFQEEVKKQSKV